MLFSIHDDDGRIHQANKVYLDPEKYPGLLNDLGHKFVAENAPGPLSPDHWYVANGAHVERSMMPIEVSKTTIKCGQDDWVLFKNIPDGVSYSVTCAGAMLYPPEGTSDLLGGNELQISMPVPCRFYVSFKKWPYKDFNTTIEAVA